MKRVLALVLVMAMVLSSGITSAFAKTTIATDSGGTADSGGIVSVKITPPIDSDMEIEGKMTLDVTVTVKDSGKTPEIKWESSKADVATVDNDGEVTAVAAGTTTITVASVADSTNKDTVEITVKPAATPADEILARITKPTAITGVANGAAKTASALGLPTTVAIVTNGSIASADITWDVANSSYAVATKTEQKFDVTGTITLPAGVVNTSNFSLKTTISVTVAAVVPPGAPTLSSIAIKTLATKTVYTVGETLDITGLVVEGTYSDGSKKDETITATNVTGFSSTTAVASQTLTITVGGKTATYAVEIKAKAVDPPQPDKAKLTAAITDAKAAKKDIITSVNGTEVAKDKKWVTAAVNSTFDTARAAANAVANKADATQTEIEAAVTMLNAAKDVYVKAQAFGSYTPSSSSGTGSGGSSSSGGTSTPPPAVDAPSSNVGGSGEVKSEDIKAETSKAVADAVKAAPGATANVTVKNADNITPTALKEMAAAATAAGGKAQLSADTVVNGVIETRLYINPALAATLTAPIKLGVSTNSLEIDATKAKFANFDNNIAVASFAQQGSFGMKIQAAVKLDLTTLNTKTLVFYSYDKATNKYIPIVAPAYTIDKNGYLHFSTTVGGDIIITDKALVAKKK